jgi:DNA-directed RNA polymerase subunit RPC12/RpoP
MLSQTSRSEILRKINSKIGFTISEESLSPAIRQAIVNLSTVQRHLFVVHEIFRGEERRVEKNPMLRMASKLGKDSEKAGRALLAEEVSDLQGEIDNKVSDLSRQILAEADARRSGQQPPEYKGKRELEQFKCPACGASLPIPTNHVVQCQYCDSKFTILDVSAQIKSMIQSI